MVSKAISTEELDPCIVPVTIRNSGGPHTAADSKLLPCISKASLFFSDLVFSGHVCSVLVLLGWYPSLIPAIKGDAKYESGHCRDGRQHELTLDHHSFQRVDAETVMTRQDFFNEDKLRQVYFKAGMDNLYTHTNLFNTQKNVVV